MTRIKFTTRLLAVGLWLAGCGLADAAIVTNVTPANVTPTGFGILCRTASAVSLAVFADPAGTSNITSQLRIESYPVHTGNPELAAGYPRRQSQTLLRQRTQALGFVNVQVSGCRPGVTYYYQFSNGAGAYYPEAGALPGITTEPENSFVIDDQQLILDIPGLDNLGRAVTVTHTNAAHPLAAIIGDGVGTNQVFFNLNDLFSQASGGNLAPLGAQTFDVQVWGAGGINVQAQFTLNFSLNFNAGQANLVSVGSEFLALTIGSAVLQVGQTTNVPVHVNTSDGLATLDVTLGVPPGHLQNLSLTSLAPEVDPAGISVTVQSASNVVLHLPARSGQSISGNKQVAQFAFRGTPGQQSAFVPLSLKQVVAARPGNSVLTNLTLASGRLVIVGAESLLEAGLGADGSRDLTLYANPNQSYALEYTTNVGPNAVWSRLRPMAITQLATPVAGLSGLAPIFYRAVQFFADPPYLEANRNPDGSRFLTLFGKPGSAYAIEAAGAVGGNPAWSGLTNIALTSAFTNIPVSNLGTIFFRAGEMFASPPIVNVVRNPDGSADLTLFGRAGFAYFLQTAPAGNTNQWGNLQRLILNRGFLSLHVTNVNTSLLRAIEYAPDPSVLELVANGDGTASLQLFGKPGSSYRIENSTTLGSGANWKSLQLLPLETSYANVSTFPMSQGASFYRAAEFTANPPLLEALLNPDRTRKLLLFGEKAQSYTVEYSTNLASQANWRPLVTNALANSFGYVSVTNTPTPIFYRLHRN